MARANMNAVLRSATATDEAKQIASDIFDKLGHLSVALKTRKEL